MLYISILYVPYIGLGYNSFFYCDKYLLKTQTGIYLLRTRTYNTYNNRDDDHVDPKNQKIAQFHEVN